jgi:hypothetical protein
MRGPFSFTGVGDRLAIAPAAVIAITLTVVAATVPIAATVIVVADDERAARRYDDRTAAVGTAMAMGAAVTARAATLRSFRRRCAERRQAGDNRKSIEFLHDDLSFKAPSERRRCEAVPTFIQRSVF